MIWGEIELETHSAAVCTTMLSEYNERSTICGDVHEHEHEH